ncbi:MAG: TolC family protein [Desulfocapsaceae bacterium]|nr:TolC family protein [Desulfocapsaceae bacterium]
MSASLAELEKRINLSDDAQMLGLEIAAGVLVKEKARADSGMKISGGVGYGWSHEPVSLTSPDMIYYEKLFNRVALTMPVLGSRWQEQAGILKSERAILDKKYNLEIYKKTALASLRKEYIEFWFSARKLELAQAFLKDEDYISSVLEERIHSGMLLNADFQEFMSFFDRARREAANSVMSMEKATRRISGLTGLTPDKASRESLSLPSPEMNAGRMEESPGVYNPELEILERIVAKNNEILNKTKWSGFESSIDLAYASEKDSPGQFGNGATITFNVKAPLDFIASNRAAEESAQLERKKSQLSLQKIRSEILNDFSGFRSTYQASLESLAFADRRLGAAYESLREARLRLKYLQGDIFEKYTQARYALFSGAIEALDAEASALKACADLLMVAEEHADQPEVRNFTSENLPGYDMRKRWISSTLFSPHAKEFEEVNAAGLKAAPAPERRVGGFGVYLWNSRDILDKDLGKFFKSLKDNRIDRILVSFDGPQIEQIRTGALKASIARLIETASGNGILVEVLLGDPSWILPERRGELLDIINSLRGLEFHGLHLDIEPDQLKKLDDHKIMTRYLLDTLKAVLAKSSWPLGISVHPRYFDEKLTGTCFGCELEKLGIAEVALMIYSSDLQVVSRRAEAIMNQYPLLPISVSQSFERSAPREESYFTLGKTVFLQNMEQLQDSIHCDNFTSIIIQSWEDLHKGH